MMNACRDCRFWVETEIVDTPQQGPSRSGQCRRFPPQLIVLVTPRGQQPTAPFPATLALDWCGEFQAKKLIET